MGGPGGDVEQGDLLHPGLDRLGQSNHGGGVVLTALALEHRVAVLVDHQVGVGRVAGVDLGGGLAQPGFDLRPEIPRGRGQIDLGAVAGDERFDLGRAEELVEEVGVGVGADHGDVAAAQLGGQVGEHAHLEMAADEAARAVPVSDRPGPVLGTE